MSQPVKLSDSLVLDARLAGDALQRSIAGQVEFWARMGKAIEPLLRGDQALALIRSGNAKPLSECLGDVDTAEGRKRVFDYLELGPYPHFSAASDAPGLLLRTDEDGTSTLGRFVSGKFVAAKTRAAKR